MSEIERASDGMRIGLSSALFSRRFGEVQCGTAKPAMRRAPVTARSERTHP